jgi:acetyl-CoA synthase
MPLGILVEVAGRQMQPDFEPILERMIHTYINEASGVFHMGQRNLNWIRISKEAQSKGFKIRHFGNIIHARYHEDYGAILDKVQVTVYTEEDKARELLEAAQAAYRQRDERLSGLTDEGVEEFYSCTLCQSFAPNHVCIITPERSGLCGGYTWLDGKANYQIVPTGPNQPVRKGRTLDTVMGEWEGVNEFLAVASRGNLEKFKAYSMMEDPMTSCGCFECISVILPLTNGIMIVDRDCADMTPCGMKFSTLAGMVGGGRQTPGFVGHSKLYISSKKFIVGDGGFKRITWMPKMLKDQVGDSLNQRAREEGIENFLDMIADETTATTEDEVMEYMMKVGHPALEMEPMMV